MVVDVFAATEGGHHTSQRPFYGSWVLKKPVRTTYLGQNYTNPSSMVLRRDSYVYSIGGALNGVVSVAIGADGVPPCEMIHISAAWWS
jgi:hypothetical protein